MGLPARLEGSSTYDSMTDESLVRLVRDNDQQAMDLVFERYKRTVNYISRKYYLAGADLDDTFQEGMIGLWKAMRDFRPESSTPFHLFAMLCIKRQIITAARNASRQKHTALNHHISLDDRVRNDPRLMLLIETIPDETCSAVEDIIAEREDAEAIIKDLSVTLTKLEKAVFAGHLDRVPYRDLAASLGCNEKTIDNALQRVKLKTTRYLARTRS